MQKIKLLVMLTAVFALAFCRPAEAGEWSTYWHNWARNLGRGLANFITSPLEIPITVQEYHEKSGRPFVRHTAGFFDGVVQTLERAGSGMWDLVVMWVPGDQEGLPPTPETLF